MRYFTFSVLTLILLLSGCSTDPSKASLPLGHTDSPQNEAVITGTYTVSGWALSPAGVEKVAVYLDGSYLGTAELGLDRPDIAKLYPAILGSETAGFKYDGSTSGMPSGRHEIVVQARTKSGALRQVGTLFVNIAP